MCASHSRSSAWCTSSTVARAGSSPVKSSASAPSRSVRARKELRLSHSVVPHRVALEEAFEVDLEPRRKRTRRNHKGRTKLSTEIERVVTKVSVPEDERDCKQCVAG